VASPQHRRPGLTEGAALLLLFSVNSEADALRVEAGRGQGLTFYALALQLDRSKPVHAYEHSQLTLHVELGVWQFQSDDGPTKTTQALAGTGKLRWEGTPISQWSPFMEFGVGLAGFSQTTVAGVRHLGGGFEFTEVLASGLRLGARGQFEIAIFGQHVSNAGINFPNEGITYIGISSCWYFR
jgi:hypothetical protein